MRLISNQGYYQAHSLSMEDWLANLLLAIGVFLVILLPHLIQWAPSNRRPLREADLGLPRKDE
jgi:hypothetical protein